MPLLSFSLITTLLLATPLPPAVPVGQGFVIQEDGVFLPLAKALDVSAKCKEAELERDSFKEILEQEPTGPSWLVAGVVGVVLGAVVGGVVVALVKK